MDLAGRETGPCVRKVDQHRDELLAEIAAAQHGVVSLAQLRSVGLSADAVRRRAVGGRLHRLYRGVYAVGHPRIDPFGRRVAALLACGAVAALSHATAADQLAMRRSTGSRIDVSVPTRAGLRRRPGLVLHRVALAPQDVALVDGLRCTTVARTLIDLAAVVDRRRIEQMIEQAERLRVFDLRDLSHAIERHRGRAGVGALRQALDGWNPPPLTRSELERRAFELFERAGLPRPGVNVPIDTDAGPVTVDFAWADRGLVVEADSFEWHSSRRCFEEDRRRDLLLRSRGWETVRITWRQVIVDPDVIIAAVDGPARRAAQALKP